MTDHPPAMHVCSHCLARVTRPFTSDVLCSRCFSILYPKADQLWEGDDLMTELSPAAQAVLDAYDNSPFDEDCGDRVAIAAALEAVADQVVPVELHPQAYEDCCQYSDVQTRAGIRANLLAIAAELRGTSTTTETP